MQKENEQLIKTLLILTNPPTIFNGEKDEEGFFVPSNLRDIKPPNVRTYQPREIKKSRHAIKTVSDLFPQYSGEEFAQLFFQRAVKRDNVSGNRFTVFKTNEKDFNENSINKIKEKYKEKIEKLKKDIAESERKRIEKRKKKNIEKRKHIFYEILTTERTYVNSLNLFLNSYVNPMKAYVDPILHKEVKQAIEYVLAINEPFLKDLGACFPKELLEECEKKNKTSIIKESNNKTKKKEIDFTEKLKVAELFISRCENFKLYSQYVNKYADIMKKINESIKTDEKFRSFATEVNNKLKRQKERATTIRSFLIMPIQRLPRYALLINDLLKKYEKTSKRYKITCTALSEIEKVANYVNTKKREKENSFKVLEISKKYKLSDLFMSSRKLRKDEKFQVDEQSGELYVFNDLLLVIKKGKLVEKIDANNPDLRCFIDKLDDTTFTIELTKVRYQLKANSPANALEIVDIINDVIKINQKLDNIHSYNANYQKEVLVGFLKKQGGGKKSKAFRKRWHVLTADKKIKYFDKMNGKFKGSYSIVNSLCGEYPKHKNCFFISTYNRVFIMKGKDKKEMDLWLDVLVNDMSCKRTNFDDLM